MGRKICKFFSALISFLPLLIVSFSQADNYGTSIMKYFTNPNNASLNIENMSSTVYSILYAVGMAVAVVMITYTAIKYSTAKPAEKADTKGRLVLIILGTIVLFVGVKITEIIFSSFQAVATDL